ncbi:hypothetical protein VTO42DRAFT_1659 [Malbranchea cinnamomea]
MASKKDMRRADLVVPYVDPPQQKGDADMSSTLASTMPMAAMFTRNKIIGWTSVVFSLQTWMSESAEQKRTANTPAYLSVMMSLMAVIVTYLPLFFPPPAARGSTSQPPSQ